ncbi:hypothetical protein HYN59_07365 [Flavobacterium album]|uniref:NlpC/P60 domain-containing protein n=1 Tax=Flavobacterium album TaxID=2175091 RepID=A0A2S1QX43_9FLAO|nr:NlpC/P60 family protein [Flavobacterium album]AWH84954.1 hypothetical protein HYN59_07365 [Flavobacterium album]
MKNLRPLTLVLFLIASFTASAQIVTSKKEAQKKGIYSYTEKQASKPAPAIDKAAVMKEVASLNDRDVVAYEPVQKKDISKGGPRKSEIERTRTNPIKNGTVIIDEATDPDFTPEPSESYLAVQIVNNAADFIGVRYRAGGTTKAGMDCSGMVYATFQIFGITLPRSSAGMAGAGRVVQLSEVKRGDLLLFKNSHNRRGINHVGIVSEVTEEGEVLFIHSSTSSGVMVSSMNEPYNARTFVQANRVIEEE